MRFYTHFNIKVLDLDILFRNNHRSAKAQTKSKTSFSKSSPNMEFDIKTNDS